MSRIIFTYFRIISSTTVFIAVLASAFSFPENADAKTEFPVVISKKAELCTVYYTEKVQKIHAICDDRMSVILSSNGRVVSIQFISKSDSSSNTSRYFVEFYRGYLTYPDDIADFMGTLSLMEKCTKIETCFAAYDSEEKTAPIFSIKQRVASWDVTLVGFGNIAPMNDEILSLFVTEEKIIGVFSDEGNVGATKTHNFFTIDK